MTSKKRPTKKTATRKRKVAETAKAETTVDAMTAFLSQGREATPTSVTYMLRCCSPQMEGHGGFKWPASGAVSAPDWKARAECGNGLHGWLMGVGDVGVSTYWQDEGARWLVCAVWSADVVDLGAKVKAPRAWVVFCGDAKKASAEIVRLGANGAVIHGTATAGDAGTATAGYAGTATAGDAGTATAGDAGTATAGVRGTATAGYAGTATAGYAGTATAGDAGTATAGEDGVIVIKHWNGSRYKLRVASVGENGIKANVAYKLDADGAFVRADGKGGKS